MVNDVTHFPLILKLVEMPHVCVCVCVVVVCVGGGGGGTPTFSYINIWLGTFLGSKLILKFKSLVGFKISNIHLGMP